MSCKAAQESWIKDTEVEKQLKFSKVNVTKISHFMFSAVIVL